MIAHTVDGSEIPNNHVGCMKPYIKIMGKTTNLNWLAGFQPSTVLPLFCSFEVRTVGQIKAVETTNHLFKGSNSKHLLTFGIWKTRV